MVVRSSAIHEMIISAFQRIPMAHAHGIQNGFVESLQDLEEQCQDSQGRGAKRGKYDM